MTAILPAHTRPAKLLLVQFADLGDDAARYGGRHRRTTPHRR